MIVNHEIYKPLYENKDKFIILVTGGRGCEHPDTPIMMADLTVKKIKDIKAGDKVMGDDVTSRNVLDVVSGRSMMYKVHQENAEDYIVNDNHILTLYHKGLEVDIHIGELLLRGTDEYYGITIPFDGNREVIYSQISIEPLGIGDYCGIHLDGNQRYLHADGTVTHNSGKSFSTSTFIERLTFELGYDLNNRKISHQILYSRYTMVSAGMSIIPEVMDKIAADGVSKYFARSGQDIVNVMTGSHIMFRGIRTSSGNQTAKLKSIKGLTVFVCDEAEEFVSEEDFEKIMFSIRQQGLKNLVIIIMNPTDSNHFIYQKYIKDTHKLVEYDGVPVQISTHPNVLHIHTSYLDNLKYLAPNFLEEAKAMKERDPERYAHIFMGKWSDVAEGAIFKKWGIVKEFPDYSKKVALCMDFGYSSDPTAIIKCGIVDNRLYMQEIKFETGMLSSDIIKVLKPYTQDGIFAYSESADPRLIDEIGLGGVIIYPVQKGAGSIIAGIDKMLTMELFVTEDSPNVQDELRNYTWAKDKNDKWTNMPIDKYNHCFVADTLVTTDQGDKRIVDVREGDMVLTSKGYSRVSRFFDNGYKNTFKTRIECGNRIFNFEATPDHKIKTSKGWKTLEELRHTDIIYGLVEGKCEAMTIDRLYKYGEFAHVYDIEVEDMHEFFANGVLVHNCMDAIRYYVLAVLLGKVMKPKKVTKEQLGIF